MDLASERTRLLQRDEEWAVAASEGRDVERILSYWTEHAVMLPPGQPAVIGKEALRQYSTRSQLAMRYPVVRALPSSTLRAAMYTGVLIIVLQRAY